MRPEPIESLYEISQLAGLTAWRNDTNDAIDFAGPLNVRFFRYTPDRRNPGALNLIDITYPVEFKRVLNEPVALAMSSDIERIIRTWHAIMLAVKSQGLRADQSAAVLDVYHRNHTMSEAGEETYTFEQCCEIVRNIPDKKLLRAACGIRRIPWAELSSLFQNQAKLGLALEMFPRSGR